MSDHRARAAWLLLLAFVTGCGGAPRREPAAAGPDTVGPATVREGDRMARAPLADVLTRHTQGLLAIPGVNGTGEGTEAGEPVLVVFVLEDTTELRARLPRTLEGYPVVVRATGTVRARTR